MTNSDTRPTEQGETTVEAALKELRQMFGSYPQIIVDIRDCGEETSSRHGRIEYCAQIGMNGEQFTARTMRGVVRKVRTWKRKQEK